MKLTRLYDERVIISRQQPTTGNKTAMMTLTAVYCNIQEQSPQMAQLTGGVYGVAYRIWVDGDVDIQNGDELRGEDGAFYRVTKGGVIRQTHGAMDFKEVMLERFTP